MKTLVKQHKLVQRRRRVRQRIFGYPERPRLNVFRSQSHIYAQIIDDTVGRTLVAASSLDKSLRSSLSSGGTTEAAREVGKLLAARAQAAQVVRVVFDRGGRLYHGRVKALAEASREGGLIF